MNIYLLHQDHNTKYDTYDALVIAAESPESAIKLSIETYRESEWVDTEAYIDCELLGVDTTGKGQRIILESFNAG